MTEPKILLLEDAPQVARIISDKLRREGFSVVWKRNLQEAKEHLRTQPADLILLAATSAGREPGDFSDAIKSLAPSNAPRVILLLENEQSQEVERAKALGFWDCILKPFKPTQLAKKVRQALQQE